MTEELELIHDEAKEAMQAALEALASELHTMRAGRASPAMLDRVRVDYYGSQSPLNQVASVSAPQPDLLVIQPWDKGALTPIEKAIANSNLGLNPSNDGSVIRIPVPTPTEERRREIVKGAKARTEDARISIRNARQAANNAVKKQVQTDKLPEDMRFDMEERIQKLTDSYTTKADDMMARKEAEIMEV
jgi:ribosome recycling factor